MLFVQQCTSLRRFRDRPFVSFGGCPIVSPLRFAADSLDVMVATARLGLVCDIAIAPQAGATSLTATRCPTARATR